MAVEISVLSLTWLPPLQGVVSTDAPLGRNVLCYEFGVKNMNTVRIIDGPTECEIVISDNHGKCFYTKCENTPLLEWAFDHMVAELKGVSFLRLKRRPGCSVACHHP